jgi:serine/threonine protein kinase
MLGAYGEVRQAKHRSTGQIRAVKIIQKHHQSKEEQEKLINEVKILKNLVTYLS